MTAYEDFMAGIKNLTGNDPLLSKARKDEDWIYPYTTPNRHVLIIEYLSNNGPLENPRHVYEVNKWTTWFIKDFTSNMILHDHPVGMSCPPRDKFCHVYGYQPVETDDPRFIVAFKKKWKHIYVSS